MERQLYFFDYVRLKPAQILELIGDGKSDLFQMATDSAVHRTAQFRSRLSVKLVGFEIGREVEITLGKPRDSGYALFVPISWRAKDQAGLFPAMDAELEISAIDEDLPLSQISILGRYRPPIGALGAVGDAMLMHRIAEASVRNFVSELCARLEKAKSGAPDR